MDLAQDTRAQQPENGNGPSAAAQVQGILTTGQAGDVDRVGGALEPDRRGTGVDDCDPCTTTVCLVNGEVVLASRVADDTLVAAPNLQ